MISNKVQSLIHALAYQSTAGVHTYGLCSNGRCENTARGSAHCSDCVEKQLMEETNLGFAFNLRMLYEQRMEIQSEIDELIGEL